MAKEVNLTGFNWSAREALVRVSADADNKWATVAVYSGCSTVQCYGKPDELRALAHALTLAADELDMAEKVAA